MKNRQVKKQTDKETDKQTDGHTDILYHRQKQTDTGRQTKLSGYTETDKQTVKWRL